MKINMRTCANGHYFNADIYATCPECDAEAEIKNSGPKMRTCPNGHYFNEELYFYCPECTADAWKKKHTAAFGTIVERLSVARGEQSPQPVPDVWSPLEMGKPDGFVTCPRGHVYPDIVFPSCPECDKTVVPRGEKFRSRPPATARCETFPEAKPVVGWLVCVEGPMRGMDFRLHDGHNIIGREEGDICLREDPAVSREKHAVITFFSENRGFSIQRPETRNYIEVDGEPLFYRSNAILHHGNILTIGKTKLKLVAFCDDTFTWEEQV